MRVADEVGDVILMGRAELRPDGGDGLELQIDDLVAALGRTGTVYAGEPASVLSLET